MAKTIWWTTKEEQLMFFNKIIIGKTSQLNEHYFQRINKIIVKNYDYNSK